MPLHRPQPRAFFGNASRRGHAGLVRRLTRVGRAKPFSDLVLEIGAIEKTPRVEKRSLDPANQIRAALTPSMWRVYFDADAKVHGGCRKRWIPFRDHAITPPVQGDRVRLIEDGDERNAAERRKVSE